MTEHIQVVPDKCRACRRCEVACIAAHHGMSFKEAMKHRDELVSRVQVVKAEGFKTTVRCHQCPHAPCVNVCPTGALQQDEQGRIIMRVQYCVACKMCMAACPYGTITMETIGMPSVDGEDGETLAQRARREVAVRCDMCRAWRVENGKRITACMEACPAHALSLVLADGTVVEAPKPEKKAVPAAAGSESAPRAEAPKTEAPQAEAAPESSEQSGSEAAGAESQKLAPKTQEAAVTTDTPAVTAAPAPETAAAQETTAAPTAEAPAAPETKAAPAPEQKIDTPQAEKAAAVKSEEKNVAQAAPAAPVKGTEGTTKKPKADEPPAAKSAENAVPSSAATARDVPVNAQEDAAKAPAEPAAQAAAEAQEAPKAVKAVEPPAVEEKPAAAKQAEKTPKAITAAPKEQAATKKSAAKSSKKTGKKSGKK